MIIVLEEAVVKISLFLFSVIYGFIFLSRDLFFHDISPLDIHHASKAYVVCCRAIFTLSAGTHHVSCAILIST